MENGGGYENLIFLPLPKVIITLKVLVWLSSLQSYTDHPKAGFAAIIVTAVATTSTKVTALLLYARIFYRDKIFKVSVIISGIAAITWLICSITVFALRCRPVYYAWDPFQVLGQNCYSLQLLFIATEVPNCILDFLIVGLPIAVIQRLNLRRKDKLLLSFVFLLGGL